MSKNKFIKELLGKIDALPEFEQKAMCWLIENIDIAEKLSKGEKVPESQIEEWKQSAISKNDHALLALAAFKKVWDEQNTGKKEKGAVSLQCLRAC